MVIFCNGLFLIRPNYFLDTQSKLTHSFPRNASQTIFHYDPFNAFLNKGIGNFMEEYVKVLNA